jgi:uncharacterized membrane protein
MSIIARLLFVLALVIVPALIYATSAGLPELVATHFGFGGVANGWMPRTGYVVFMLALTTLLPLIIVATSGLVPALTMSSRMVRNPDYWLAPARREATQGWLASHACWMGVVLILFLGGAHLVVVQANTHTPPQLAEAPLFVLLAALLVAIALWVITLHRRFRQVR